MISAGSSAAVSNGVKESEAACISRSRPSAPSSGPSWLSTRESAGSWGRISTSLARPSASVISALAPESDSRKDKASGPKSTKSGTAIAPSL